MGFPSSTLTAYLGPQRMGGGWGREEKSLGSHRAAQRLSSKTRRWGRTPRTHGRTAGGRVFIPTPRSACVWRLEKNFQTQGRMRE